MTHKLENNSISQKLYHRSEIPGSHIRLPSLGLAMRGKVPRESGFEGQCSLTPEFPQDWWKQKLHYWKVHTKSHLHQDPEQKAVTSSNTEPDLAAGVGGSPAEVGAAVAHCGDKDMGSSSLGKSLLVWALQEATVSPSSSLRSPVLGCFGSNNQQGGNTAPPISRQVA